MNEQNDDSRINDWGVLHRIATDDGETRRLRLRLRDVPESKGRKDIKLALERAGRVYGEGAIPWGNHTVLPRDEWLDLDNEATETLTYADLLDEARGEKRVTVRLPIGLHAQLVKTAGTKSFNQFVTETLATAIGYEDESIDLSFPRLAARQGVTVEELQGKLAKWSTADTSQSPFAKQFGEGLAKISGLSPEQLKARSDAFMSSPQWAEAQKIHERIQSGEDVFADVPEEQIIDAAAKLGLSVEQFRERMKQSAEKTRDIDWETETAKMSQRSAQEVKDHTLLLRDVFTGRAANYPDTPDAGSSNEINANS